MKIVIMAGGSGTRLWPMSRGNMPKQLQKLVGDKTLIQQTCDRIKGLADPADIYISTVGKYVDEILRQLPEVPRENVLVEPLLKGNAAAIGLTAIHLFKNDPNAVMVMLPADHVVTELEMFHKVVRAAVDIVENDPQKLVTIGIKPTSPNTELGYIQMNKLYKEVDGLEVFTVKQFVEKPDLVKAQKFVTNWQYLWNSGYFIWKVSTMLELYKQFLPNTYKQLEVIANSIGTPKYQAVLSECYAMTDETSIDFGIIEKAKEILVVPADLGWSDVGTWSSLHDILSSITGHHTISKGHHTGIDSENCLVYAGEKMIATVGLKNIIIVDTPDVLFIADKSSAKNVKKIQEKLKEEGKHLYL